MFSDLVSLILIIAPSVFTAFMTITTIAVVVNRFKAVIETFKLFKKDNDAEIKAAWDQVQICIQENYELKRQINELLCKLDHVKRSDNENIRRNQKV